MSEQALDAMSTEETLEAYLGALRWCERYFVRLESADDGRWSAAVYSRALNMEIEHDDHTFLMAIEGLRTRVKQPPLGDEY